MNHLAIDLLLKGIGALEFQKRSCPQHYHAQLQRDIDAIRKSIWSLEQYHTTQAAPTKEQP